MTLPHSLKRQYLDLLMSSVGNHREDSERNALIETLREVRSQISTDKRFGRGGYNDKEYVLYAYDSWITILRGGWA